jgi:hypothetical protein
MEERRIIERVKPDNNCIVVHSKTVGNIKDISPGGLYCTCFQDSTCKTNIQREIDILCGHGQFLVKGLKVKVVHSETIAGRFLTNFEVKKCRLQFVEMQDEQSAGIEAIVAGTCIH